jgi:hypothetical protein
MLTASCVSDTPLSAEIEQLVEQLRQCRADLNPNAHACRLKLLLVTMHSTIQCPWIAAEDIYAYVLKRDHVSAGCRLTPKEVSYIILFSDIRTQDLCSFFLNVTAVYVRCTNSI